MGYFDGLTAAAFKTDSRGRDLFFIWGKFGKGRVIPSEADGAAVRSYLKNYYICVLVGILPTVMLGGEAGQPRWFLTIAIFMALALAGLVPLWLRTRQWALADERLTYRVCQAAACRTVVEGRVARCPRCGAVMASSRVLRVRGGFSWRAACSLSGSSRPFPPSRACSWIPASCSHCPTIRWRRFCSWRRLASSWASAWWRLSPVAGN